MRVPPTFLLSHSIPLCLFSSLFLSCASLYLLMCVSLVRARARSLFLPDSISPSIFGRLSLVPSRSTSCSLVFAFFLSFQCALAADDDFVDTISTDGGGRNYLWYSKNVKKTSYICSSNDAQTMCPMTCRGKVLHVNIMDVQIVI